MKEAVRPSGGSPKIAVAVKDNEGVIVFEDVARASGGGRCRNVERRLGNSWSP
jgi:hypothetical protein